VFSGSSNTRLENRRRFELPQSAGNYQSSSYYQGRESRAPATAGKNITACNGNGGQPTSRDAGRPRKQIGLLLPISLQSYPASTIQPKLPAFCCLRQSPARPAATAEKVRNVRMGAAFFSGDFSCAERPPSGLLGGTTRVDMPRAGKWMRSV
jgi:hypothetical protein